MGEIVILVTALQNLFEIRKFQICQNWRTRINSSADGWLGWIMIKVHSVDFWHLLWEEKAQNIVNLARIPHWSTALWKLLPSTFHLLFLHKSLLKFIDLTFNRNKCDVQPCFILAMIIHRHRDYLGKDIDCPNFLISKRVINNKNALFFISVMKIGNIYSFSFYGTRNAL